MAIIMVKNSDVAADWDLNGLKVDYLKDHEVCFFDIKDTDYIKWSIEEHAKWNELGEGATATCIGCDPSVAETFRETGYEIGGPYFSWHLQEKHIVLYKHLVWLFEQGLI